MAVDQQGEKKVWQRFDKKKQRNPSPNLKGKMLFPKYPTI